MFDITPPTEPKPTLNRYELKKKFEGVNIKKSKYPIQIWCLEETDQYYANGEKADPIVQTKIIQNNDDDFLAFGLSKISKDEAEQYLKVKKQPQPENDWSKLKELCEIMGNEGEWADLMSLCDVMINS